MWGAKYTDAFRAFWECTTILGWGLPSVARSIIWIQWVSGNVQDLSPKFAAALLGLTNTAGALPGILGITSVGLLLDKTNSWAWSLFVPIATCQIFGLIIYSVFASGKRAAFDS